MDKQKKAKKNEFKAISILLNSYSKNVEKKVDTEYVNLFNNQKQITTTTTKNGLNILFFMVCKIVRSLIFFKIKKSLKSSFFLIR